MRNRALLGSLLLLFPVMLYAGAEAAPVAELQVSLISGATASAGCVGCPTGDVDTLCLDDDGAAGPVRIRVIASNTGTVTSAGILRYFRTPVGSTTTIVSAPAGWTCTNPDGFTAGDCLSPGWPADTGVPAGSSHEFVFEHVPAGDNSLAQFSLELSGGSNDDACVGVRLAPARAEPIPALDPAGLAVLALLVGAVAFFVLRAR